MRVRLIVWPLAVAYMCFLVAGNATVEPMAFTGAVFGAILGIACASVFSRRARRYQERELTRLLTRY